MRLLDVYDVCGAVKVLYELLKERSTEKDKSINISHRKLPSWEEHNEFFYSRPFAVWKLIEVEGEWIGYVSITKRNEIGIVLFRKFRGKGYGKEALKMLIDSTEPMPGVPSERPANFVANINPKNKKSIALFRGLGFKHIQNTYERTET